MQWAGWIDFYNEIYLNLSISAMINISVPTMDNASEIGNNTFSLIVGASLAFIPIIIAFKFSQGY